jgi:hypothetical protein
MPAAFEARPRTAPFVADFAGAGAASTSLKGEEVERSRLTAAVLRAIPNVTEIGKRNSIG